MLRLCVYVLQAAPENGSQPLTAAEMARNALSIYATWNAYSPNKKLKAVLNDSKIMEAVQMCSSGGQINL